MDNNKAWAMVVGIVLIFALTALGIVLIIRNTILGTLEPVQNVSDNVSTRVAEVFHPTPTILPDPVTIVRSVRSLARLETIQYSVEKVITAETGQGPFGFLFGDKLIFVAHGTVVAGVDMEKLTPEDLEVRDGTLYVRLPEPEIFVATLDNDKSYVYSRDRGVLNRGDIHLEATARQSAEAEIEKAAVEDGILRLAGQNAQTYLYRLFRDLGYSEVSFVGEAQTPTPALSTPGG
jgi:hypothetical protein